MLPNVIVNITEESTSNTLSLNSFLPLVILKAKTGPIGTATLVTSEKGFLNTFGTTDSSVPAAFGLRQYIKNYGKAYIVRIAHSVAALGTAVIKGTIATVDTDLISVSTKYKTDTLNGSEVKLVYDSATTKIYISAVIDSTVVTSVKETLNYSTATADLIETALNKIITSFNEAQEKYELSNLFSGKESSDQKPTTFTELVGTISGGNNGNTGITDEEVITEIAKYEDSDLGIDAILAPEFEGVTVINKLAEIADASSFMAIASITGSTLSSIVSVANTCDESKSLALYAGNVYLTADTSILVPAAIAVLPSYITTNISSKWLAPAGITRGTLSTVSSVVPSLSSSELSDLYANTIPVNGIRKISGVGYIVWGQKTTSQEATQYLDRINVSRLVKYLTKSIDIISLDYLFEPINDFTYSSWTMRVETLMSQIKNGNGLSSYKITMDGTLNTAETISQNKLIGEVKFKPLEAAEEIILSFVITDETAE